MPLPLLLAAAAVPSIYKGIAGIVQGNQADNLKKRDTTPAAFTEALGVTRQAAAAGLPGEALQLNRLDAGQNSALAAGERAGTSSSSILGLLSSTNENRTRALGDLSARSEASRQQQQRTLTGMLQQQAAYQKGDQVEFDRNRAALKESSQRNIYGALEGASQVAAYGLKADAGGAGGGGNILGGPVPPGVAPEVPGVDPFGYLPGTRRPRYNTYGVPDEGYGLGSSRIY